MVGFKLHWQLAPEQTEALREFMDLFLFSGGYGGLSLVEADVANLCLVVRRKTLRKIGGWNQLLAMLLGENHLLAQRLQNATAAVGTPPGHFADPIRVSRSKGRWTLARRRSGRSHPFIHWRRHGNRLA